MVALSGAPQYSYFLSSTLRISRRVSARHAHVVRIACAPIHVVLIEENDLLLSQLAAPELSAFFSRYCMDRGIELRTNDTAAAFQGSGRIEAVAARSGEIWPRDLVVVAIGVTPEWLRVPPPWFIGKPPHCRP